MRALALKERSLEVSSSLVSNDIRKAKIEISAFEKQKKIFTEKLKSLIEQSKATTLRSPEAFQSLANLKNKISSSSNKHEIAKSKLASLVNKHEIINSQSKIISDKIQKTLIIEKEKKDSIELDGIIEFQGTIKALAENQQNCAKSNIKSVDALKPLSVSQQPITSDVSLNLKRGDGVPAFLQVSLDPLGGVSALVQTTTNTSHEKSDLERRMKRALSHNKDSTDVFISVEEY